ncbi:MAG: hypothetical protein GKR77_07630, partial [Legionellales bacterium]|nr:hypothetical protein [Legionellales bacterium]
MKRFAQWWGRNFCVPERRCEHPENCVQREAQWMNDAIFCSALRDIKNEVSCPPVAFSKLYRQPLLRVAQLTQKVPVSGDDASPYFTYMVAQAVRALRYKREWLMLGDGHAESMAAWDAAWTFAVFSSALCYGWLTWEARWQFFWCDDGKLPVRWQTWSPSVGALPEAATHYRWKANKSACVVNSKQAVRQGFVVAHWFDVDVMRWLQGYPKVMDSWWGTIGGEWACDDPLGKVLQASFEK